MEGQPAKRRRVYSLEPNKVVQSVFTRNYVSYLVPALTKIKEKSPTEDCSHCDFKNVKYEVDMAMVFSAQGFAWSHGLRVKLQRDHVNVATSTGFLENEAGGEGSSRNCNQNGMVPVLDLTSNPSSKSQVEILVSKPEFKDMPEIRNDYAREDNEDEDDKIKSQLSSLRRLIPGGEEMCDEQMASELESYIRCLQMQVDVLQCLLSEAS